MKPKPTEQAEKCRVKRGILASTQDAGNNGAFLLQTPDNVLLQVIVSDGAGWEHVSVTPARLNRVPTWNEMCFVKDMFWDEEETVVQYHPPKSEYVNLHPNCLHLWKPVNLEIPVPPSILVGPKKPKRHELVRTEA